jgi:hypothetical protein
MKQAAMPICSCQRASTGDRTSALSVCAKPRFGQGAGVGVLEPGHSRPASAMGPASPPQSSQAGLAWPCVHSPFCTCDNHASSAPAVPQAGTGHYCKLPGPMGRGRGVSPLLKQPRSPTQEQCLSHKSPRPSRGPAASKWQAHISADTATERRDWGGRGDGGPVCRCLRKAALCQGAGLLGGPPCPVLPRCRTHSQRTACTRGAGLCLPRSDSKGLNIR